MSCLRSISYTEYFIEVSNLANGDKWTVSRRYREIRELHDHLKLKYPDRIPKVGNLIYNKHPIRMSTSVLIWSAGGMTFET